MFEKYLEKLSAQTFYGHTWLSLLLALGLLILVAAVSRLIQGAILLRAKKLAERTETELDDAWIHVLSSTAWFFHLGLGLLTVRYSLDLSAKTSEVLRAGLFIVFGIQVVLWIQSAVGTFLGVWARREGTSHANTAAEAIRFVVRLIIWVVFLMVVLSNLGVEVTTIVAGLGVGGVAAALAVQKVLGDLISGLSMYFDRPFDIGDFVIVDDVKGNVTKIGLRTTRLDGLGGEKIIYPNGELVSKCIHNYQRMTERRIVFAFGIEYGLSAQKVKQARDIAEEVVKATDNVRFDRAHFHKFGSSSLDYEVVYFVLSRDYTEYMVAQHAINMRLYERFEEAEIPFAYPTQTLHHRGLPQVIGVSEQEPTS